MKFMQKRKKGMQDQTATQKVETNELSDDQLLEASGGEARVSEYYGSRHGYAV